MNQEEGQFNYPIWWIQKVKKQYKSDWENILNVYAILLPFNSISLIKIFNVFCPKLKPPSKADSTFTSNHELIDFVKKLTETK